MTTLQAMNSAPALTDADLGRDLITVTIRPDTVFVDGQGSWLTDESGKRYLDLVQGWAVNSLGHSPAVIAEALARQSRRLLNPSPAFHNRPMLDLSARLVGLSCFDRVWFGSSGAEVNEAAVKLARRWGQRMCHGAHEVISFEGAFHGRTLAMMRASGKPGWDSVFAPMPEGFARARFNDITSVERAITPASVAVMIELVQGEAGVNVADPGFMRELRALSTERQLLLIADEVQTGIGRCGRAFAHELFDIEPDLMTLAKGIGGGVPLAALLCKEAFNCFAPGDQGGTYGGNALMASVGLAVVDTVCHDGFLAQVRQRADHFSRGLQAIVQDHVLVAERGAGLLRALVLPTDMAPQVVEAAQALSPVGLLINAPRPNLLRFMPALTISDDKSIRACSCCAKRCMPPWAELPAPRALLLRRRVERVIAWMRIYAERRPLCSGCCRSSAAAELTVSDILRSLEPGRDLATSGRYQGTADIAGDCGRAVMNKLTP